MSVLGVDPPEVLEIDGDDAHHVALGVAFEQRALDAVDEEHAVGELRERIVERAIGELALERGEPEQRVVEAAALDRQRDQVGQVLEVWSIVGARFAAFRARACRAPGIRRCATRGAA